jgi:hypothetical protein
MTGPRVKLDIDSTRDALGDLGLRVSRDCGH